MPTRQRKGRAWSLADDAKLRAAGERGPISPAVARALAGELGRSVGALQVRASQFGLLALPDVPVSCRFLERRVQDRF